MPEDIRINETCVVSRCKDTSGLRVSRIIMQIRFMDRISPTRIAEIKCQLPLGTCADGTDSSRLFVSLASEDLFGRVIYFLNEV